MGLFRRLGDSLTLKVIDWNDSSKNTMVHKYPMDGRKIFFGSKLTVRDSQVAIFMNKGEIADVFTPGMYTLKSNNLPILSSLLGLPYGFKSPFLADVFFVNTKQFTNKKWGTSNPITMRDKEFGTIRIRAFGSYAFKVVDAVKFLKELFGTNSSFVTEDIENYLKSMLVSAISDTIAESKISALDLACNLLEFNKMTREAVKSHFEPLGLEITNCVIENISFPEEVEKAIDKATSMGVLGDKMDTYIKYQAAESLKESAKNPGMGGLGTQLGTGMALGEIVKNAFSQPSAPKEAPATGGTDKKTCPKCKTENKAKAKFCTECGHKFTAEKFCPECGAKTKDTAKFCPECGAKIK